MQSVRTNTRCSGKCCIQQGINFRSDDRNESYFILTDFIKAVQFSWHFGVYL